MRITQEKSKCIGCGSCVAVCPKYWKMAEDGKAHLLGSEHDMEKNTETLEVKEAGCNQDAADACPVECIHIEK